MPFGIRAWDTSNNLTLDLSGRITRVLGQQQLWTATGSIYDPNLAMGSLWYDFVVADDSGPSGIWGTVPHVALSGWTLSWSGAGTSGHYWLRYGVY